MLPHRTLPHLAILLIGQAVLDAGPAIVAEREGGMGLGSALIAATVTRLAGIVVGAILGGLVADRSSVALALLTGALLSYIGLLTTGIAPMGSLATVVAGMGVAGIGFGFLLTAAFTDAASLEVPRQRALAVGLLLAVLIAGRPVAGAAFAAGPVAFIVAGAAVVGLAILAARLAGSVARDGARLSGSAPSAPRSTGPAVLSAAMLGLGTLLSVAGADPSRLSASLLVGIVGGGGLESLDVARAAMAAIGVMLMLAGGAMLLAGTERVVRIAAPGVLLVGFAGAGVAASLTQALTAGRVPGGSVALIGATGTLAGLAGLAIGGRLAIGAGGRWLPVAVGSATLAVACALGWLTLIGPRPEPGAVAPIVLIAVAGLAAGIAVAGLRLALTDVRPTGRGLAAGAGVAAATIGTAVGGLLGAGEGAALVGGAPRGLATGLGAFVIAAVAATALSALLRRRASPEIDSASRRSLIRAMPAGQAVQPGEDADQAEL